MRWAPVLLACFLALTTVGQAVAEKRVALVIGNDSYVHQPRLENPGRDAQIIGSALQNIGFELVGGGPLLDLDQVTTDKMIETFSEVAKDSDLALFYFFGYGIQIGGANYLLPVDLISTDETVKVRALSADFVVKTISTSRARLILLDAKGFGCGLAPMEAPAGTAIGFAAQPNATATQGPSDGNSPYAKAIATYLTVKNLGVWQLLNEVGLAVMMETNNQQQPWISYSPMKGVVYLNPPNVEGKAILATGYSPLLELGREVTGYGLYSYAVLTSDSNRSSAFLKEIFNSTPKIEDAAAESSQLNIFYLPTKKNSLAELESSNGQNWAEFGRKFSNSFYDYKIARAILNHICNPPADVVRKLCQQDVSRGPYIFSYAKPASALEPVPPPFLFVDLSDVDLRAFGEFIAAFRAQVKREDISDSARINTLRLTILKITLKAGDLVVPIRRSIANIIYSSGAEKARGK